MTQTYAQSIHAHLANEIRRKQKLDADAELEWSDRIPPFPRAYIKVKTPWTDYLSGFNLKHYLP